MLTLKYFSLLSWALFGLFFFTSALGLLFDTLVCECLIQRFIVSRKVCVNCLVNNKQVFRNKITSFFKNPVKSYFVNTRFGELKIIRDSNGYQYFQYFDLLQELIFDRALHSDDFCDVSHVPSLDGWIMQDTPPGL